jgi:oligopeptide/dipeptide ABC transporter ATP-binding protein
LIAAVPVPDPALARRDRQPVIEGEIPSPLSPPSGCRFRTRCPYAKPLCAEADPPLGSDDNHDVACHFWREIAPHTAQRTSRTPNARLEKLQAAFASRAS